MVCFAGLYAMKPVVAAFRQNDLKRKIASKGCHSADSVTRCGAPEVTQLVDAARRDTASRTRIDHLRSGEAVPLACRK
jgi:hypothetical protein